MRGINCTKFTWICLFSYSMTDSAGHKANRNTFFMLASITETICISLHDQDVVVKSRHDV